MQGRLERFGTQTNLSAKQYARIIKVTKARDNIKPSIGFRHGKSIRFQKYKVFPQRNILRNWRLTFGSTAAICAFLFLIMGWISERFPEYIGSVVSLSSTQEIVGRVTHVRDGDTIEVEGIPIRFGSLNCAESTTSKGQLATAKIRALIAGQTLTCHLSGRTSYDRKIGSCRLPDGRDLGGIMIDEGYCQRFW
ncbi:thermonuclease family protein [Limimaricola soesokkakensis]|uniref:thermonuclease family protein n=1 Tax=Limimaricola soesokkakensis TaxID=1343159 RepID=UPI003559CFE5